MGIAGLLQFISSAKEHTRVSRFKGHRVGVDASGWMHRSLSTCARELALGIETDKHIKYCLSLVRALRRDGVEPLLVFDGAPIAQKALTNSQRGDVRKAAKREVEAKRSAGEDAEADKLCRKSIGVPAEMVQQLIVALRAEGVAFLVAPYEADAQLAFLARTGQVAAVISEDSDLCGAFRAACAGAWRVALPRATRAPRAPEPTWLACWPVPLSFALTACVCLLPALCVSAVALRSPSACTRPGPRPWPFSVPINRVPPRAPCSPRSWPLVLPSPASRLARRESFSNSI
jgi:exonuclease-1